MTLLVELRSALQHMVEVQAPPIDELPPGTDSADWVRKEGIVRGMADMSGKLIGFRRDGISSLLDLAKKMRTRHPAYARGTRPRSFLDAVLVLLVDIKRAANPGPIELGDLDQFEKAFEAWFAKSASSRTHLIPCSILPGAAPAFSIGAIRFIHKSHFDPGEFGGVAATYDINFGLLLRFMGETAATWIAVVPVEGCDKHRSLELAELATDVALGALQLVIPPDYGALIARMTGRARPPYTVTVTIENGSPSPITTNSEPGKGLSGDVFADLVSQSASLLQSAGHRIDNFLSGTGRLPMLSQAWCDAAFWFHEALAEPLDTVSIAKLETSIENLFCAGNLAESTARLLQAFRGVFGLKPEDLIEPKSTVTVKAYAESVVRSRSRILHGTWSTLTTELDLTRGEVSMLTHTLLVSYTLYLDQYGREPLPEDKAKPFVDWMEKQRTIDAP